MGDAPAILLAGPTASGKSALAMAVCERLGGGVEIVSVDSAQVYRGMDVGTAKPDADARRRVPHHLLDILDPTECYSAARFAIDARAAMADIRARGHRPLLVGGTMLYFRALMVGLSPLPAADPVLRKRIAAEARHLGWPALHTRLAGVDAAVAARIHSNDAQRIQRALEIHALTGETPSRVYRRGRAEAAHGPWLAFALFPDDRSRLHARIEARLDAMIAHGFLDEVRQLRARGDLSPDLPSMRAVGYRQMWAYLNSDCDFAGARQRALAATRQYAKRQYTWLRSEADFQRLPERDAADFILRRLAAEDGA